MNLYYHIFMSRLFSESLLEGYDIDAYSDEYLFLSFIKNLNEDFDSYLDLWEMSLGERIDFKSQSSKRKSLGRGSSIRDGAKKRGYESPSEFRDEESRNAQMMNKVSERLDAQKRAKVAEELISELRRSEKEGYGSPEVRSDMSPTGYLGRARMQKKKRGEMGGRHSYSGNQEDGGSRIERGKKKRDADSQYSRIERELGRNEEGRKNRQLRRGTRAATERAYGYRDGEPGRRYYGD